MLKHTTKKILNISACAAVSTILSGCITIVHHNAPASSSDPDVTTTIESTEKAPDFLFYLAQQYDSFAQQEALKYDWLDSKHFKKKAEQARNGIMVAPEHPIDWNSPRDVFDEMVEARNLLLRVLTPSVQESAPKASAQAVFYYDCWLEERQENSPEQSVDNCRSAFFDALNYLSVIYDAANIAPALAADNIQESIVTPSPSITLENSDNEERSALNNKTAPSATATENDPISETEELPIIIPGENIHVIYFTEGGKNMDPGSSGIIDAIVTSVETLEDFRIILNGHTDRVGTAEDNLMLSQKMAAMVKEELVKKNILDSQINVFGFGETDNEITTDDDIAEAKNRRVEIVIE